MSYFLFKLFERIPCPSDDDRDYEEEDCLKISSSSYYFSQLDMLTILFYAAVSSIKPDVIKMHQKTKNKMQI